MLRQRKIAVLTKANYKYQARDYRVDYFVWGKLSEYDSLSDYDILIVDLASLRNRNIVRWHVFEKILNPTVTRDVLVGGGKIVIAGNPNFHHQSVVSKKRVPFLSWSGLVCDWVDQSGDTVIPAAKDLSPGIQRYMSHLGRWSCALRSCEAHPGFVRMLTRASADPEHSSNFRAECRHFYRNRYNCALAFAVTFAVLRDCEKGGKTIGRLGPVLFLPETNLGAEEALEMILRDICEIQTASREPGWARELHLPNHAEIDQEIIDRMAEIENAYDRLSYLEHLRTRSREALRLLYDSGSTLEEVVREVLAELGAEVIAPEMAGADSGKIAVELNGQRYEGLLQTVAIAKSEFAESELDKLGRQLSLAVETDRKGYKGILVGNAGVDRSPDQRDDPFTFHFNENAKLRHVTLLRTQDLFDVYLMHLQGTLNRDSFWSEVFSRDGQFDMRRVTQTGPPAPEPAPSK